MNKINTFSILLAGMMLTSGMAAGAKDRNRSEKPRLPTAICSLFTDTIKALPSKDVPNPSDNNSMVLKLRKIQTVMLFDHMTAKPQAMLSLKPLDTVVVIQDQPDDGGRGFNYATKETAEFYTVTAIDPAADSEMYAKISRPEQMAGKVYIARYNHFLDLPELKMNMSFVVDERRQQNKIFSRRAHLVLGSLDGQASVSLNCHIPSGERFTFSQTIGL